MENRISNFWEKKLVCIFPEILTTLSFPTKTVQFLLHVGLPVNISNPLNIVFTPSHLNKLNYRGNNYLEIGYIQLNETDKVSIALEDVNGEVYLLDLRPNVVNDNEYDAVQFINSSVIDLLLCLIEYHEYQTDLVDLFKLERGDSISDLVYKDFEQLNDNAWKLYSTITIRLRSIDEAAVETKSENQPYWLEIIADHILYGRISRL